MTQPITKAIIVIRTLPGESSETTTHHKDSLLTACQKNNLEVIEIFYYQIGDSIRRENIIRYIRKLGEKIAIITYHVISKNNRKQDKPFFKKLVKEDLVEVYKLIDGDLYKI